LREYDWNMILQRMVCILTWWILIFAIPISKQDSPLPVWKLAVIASLAPLLFVINGGLAKALPDVHRQTEQYSHLDISFLLATDLLDPGHRASCDEFCRFLTQNANVSVPLTVPDVALMRSTAGEKPFNIFIVVIDNLRQDELAPYNPAVDFMPHLKDFAAESTVFRNAYTRYDGTILSELALWAGTSQIHKEFAQPFSRQNALAKLAQSHGYNSYVTWDEILSNVLDEKEFSFTKLDTEVHAWKEIDFCKTVPRFTEALRNRPAGRPIFFYSQPKNVHGAALALQRFPKPQRSYAGLTPYYSQAAERMDGCFGNFIQALRSEGLFDDSLIAVTSDHGDSMDDVHAGGHGLHLRPSELRVPLIVHVPKSISSRYVAAPSQVAFVSDITPTIAYLLGERIAAPPAMSGRPLFTRTLAEQTAAARPFYLVESSYFPVFGILSDNGSKLYLDNAQIKSREYYDLAADPKAQHNLADPQSIKQGQQRIREELDALNRWYRLQPPKNDFLHWWLQEP